MAAQQHLPFVPGQRLSLTHMFTLPAAASAGPSSLSCTVTVLDVPSGGAADHACCAIVVPSGEEEDWIYASEGGQWQLASSASVARLVLVARSGARPGPAQRQLEAALQPLVQLLAPRGARDKGAGVPFVSYADDVLRRETLEVLDSPVSGPMVVEDVEVALDEAAAAGQGQVAQRGAPPAPATSAHEADAEGGAVERTALRRRLRFKSMPNLIQSEVPLHLSDCAPCGAAAASNAAGEVSSQGGRAAEGHANDIRPGGGGGLLLAATGRAARRPDYSRLVHKYLPPIVAGFTLVGRALQDEVDAGRQPGVLAIGGGACTLPIFLHRHFPFRIEVVEMDELVIQLARRHFGLEEDARLVVYVAEGAAFTAERAAAIAACAVPPAGGTASLPGEHRSEDGGAGPGSVSAPAGRSDDRQTGGGQEGDTCTISSGSRLPEGPAREEQGVRGHSQKPGAESWPSGRIHVLVVDIDAGDARLPLSSPPAAFLERPFLSAARALLDPGGLLALNVIPTSLAPMAGVVATLKGLFEEVFESTVEGDINRVMFAVPRAARQSARFMERVTTVIPPHLLRDIRRL